MDILLKSLRLFFGSSPSGSTTVICPLSRDVLIKYIRYQKCSSKVALIQKLLNNKLRFKYIIKQQITKYYKWAFSHRYSWGCWKSYFKTFLGTMSMPKILYQNTHFGMFAKSFFFLIYIIVALVDNFLFSFKIPNYNDLYENKFHGCLGCILSYTKKPVRLSIHF